MYGLVLFSLVFIVTEASQVLLVSMDGFRWDYLDKISTPNFDALAKRGTKAKYINNTFITKTFPCHYTIVTGLYEESHGIIGNAMYDPVFNSTFKMSTTEPRWWDGGEPIWVTARKNNLTSAVYFWPGSEAKIRGYRPNHWKPYNESIGFTDRVDQVIQWLAVEHIDFVAMYFQEPDATGHLYGPDSPQVKDKVEYMDSILGYIMKKFDTHGLWNKVNLVLTSDHGMTNIDTANKVIDISEHVNMSDIFTIDNGPIMQVYPKQGKTDDVINQLNSTRNMTVFKKEDIPDFWHYGKNRRVMPVFLLADEGWSIITNKTALKSYKEKGNHGYDNRLLSMKPIFLAAGPNIKVNHVTPTFRSVDIYPMICNLLNITAAPNNGSLLRTSNFIVPYNRDVSSATQLQQLQISGLLVFMLVLTKCIC